MKQLISGKSKLIMEKNPFAEPIAKFYSEMTGKEWEFPFVPQIIHSLVISVVIVILIILYATIGIVSQISSIFWNLIVQTGQKIEMDNLIESSAYAIAIGIYFILFLPFFLIQFPFWLLGWFISKIGFKTFVGIISIIMITLVILYFNPALFNSFRKSFGYSDTPATKLVNPDTNKTPELIITNKKNDKHKVKLHNN